MNRKCNISESLTELMLERNISNQKLADDIGVASTAVRRWRRDASSLELQSLLKLCNYFKCSIEFLLNRTDVRLDYIPHECPPFYDWFNKVMYESGYTRYTFAAKTQFGEGHLYRWRQGSVPKLSTLVELAALFSCTVDYLIGREQ